MKKGQMVLILEILISIILLSGCITQEPPPYTIEIKNDAFQPISMTVTVNTTVIWNNHNGKAETVTSKDGSFDSGDIPDGYEFRHTFLQSGTYEYYSDKNKSMTGEIVVGTGTTPPAQAQQQVTSAQQPSSTQAESVIVWLSVKNIAYNKSEIKVPAGAHVTVNFDNQDNGIPHNFAVYDTSAAKINIFRGAIVTGPKKTTYNFTAPDTPGTYFFRCDVHPTQMTGQFIVTQAVTAAPVSQENKTVAASSKTNATASTPTETQSSTTQATSTGGQSQGASSQTSAGKGTPPVMVKISNFRYNPNALSVFVGTTINWTNYDSVQHTVTSTEGHFDSGPLNQGETFSHKFDKLGTFGYFDALNPYMNGSVTVEYNVSSNILSSQSSSQTTVTNESAGLKPTVPNTTAKSPQKIVIGLIAKNIAYNTSTITVPAGANVTVNFDNQDSGVPHNFAVYDTSAAKNLIFRGAIITGPKKIAYNFTAPDKPGTYFFRCDVHPTIMKGQFIVK